LAWKASFAAALKQHGSHTGGTGAPDIHRGAVAHVKNGFRVEAQLDGGAAEDGGRGLGGAYLAGNDNDVEAFRQTARATEDGGVRPNWK
jgi:hypothetical protein